jgi:hypothetical protein
MRAHKAPARFYAAPGSYFLSFIKIGPGKFNHEKSPPPPLPAARRSGILLAQGAAVVIDFYYVRLQKKFMGQIF